MVSSSPSPENAAPKSPREPLSPTQNSIYHLSPQRPSTYGRDGRDGRKERRNPSITPRKFTRFFTPRSHGSMQTSSARQALYDITAPANNRNGIQSSPPQPPRNSLGEDNSPAAFPRDFKRRKLIHISGDPDKKSHSADFMGRYDAEAEMDSAQIPSSPCERAMSYACLGNEENVCDFVPPVKCITPVEDRGIGGRLLQLSIGSQVRSRRQHYTYPVNDYEDETASFYTRPSDVHICMSMEGSDRCIPFCTTSCNTNSLIAIGDEEGRIRLLESSKDGRPGFKDTFLAFRIHTNAIIDMTFSQDDSLLATASGDQTARVVDMATQTTLSVLANHSASLKQVRFQPGGTNNSVLATSSRDGSVQIWDLRCKGSEGPVQQIHAPIAPNENSPGARKVTYGYAVNSIYDAHRPSYHTRASQPIGQIDAPSRGEVPGRLGDVSVTAIAFLQPGQEHLLLTASEADASVKLWDIRSLHNSRRKGATALSYTQQPQSHSQWRHFGINSLNVSGDGSRFYTLCKDNTVYAYSTSHLILGHAPELSSMSQERRRPQRETQEGLGPIYGFRHPKLHATSFYVKSALRKAQNGKSEMLAVGSSDGCAILFPTDERYFSWQKSSNATQKETNYTSRFGPRLRQRSSLRRTGSGVGLSGRVDDTIPISQNGTPLIRAHDREVGALSWTAEGNLISVGDDFLIRCWREGPDARELRIGGEHEGRRWRCGWADVDVKYDDDDD